MAAPVAAREPDYDDEFAGDDEPAQAPSVAAAVTYLASFAALAALAEQRDVRLYHDLMENVRLVRFEPGRLIIRPTEAAPANLAQRLMSRIEEWTGSRWAIVIDNDAQGEPPLAEQQRQAQAALLQAAENHPLVQAIREQFPDATIADVRPLDADGDS